MPIEPKIESQSHRFNRYYSNVEPLLTHPTVQAYTMLVLSFFTMSFFGYFAIRPTLTTISTLQRQITDARYVDQKLQEKINALTQASNAYQAIKPDLNLVYTALPKENQFAPFVKGLERLATESGTTISSLNFDSVNLSSTQATVSSAKETPISFSITLSGDYAKLADFVKRLSRFERLAIVEKIGLASVAEEGKTETLRLTLVGETFYVK